MVVMQYEGDCESFIQLKRQLLLPFYYRNFLIELTKQWMIVMKYEGECIGNMEWVGSYENFIQSKKKLLLPCCYRQCSIELTKQWMGVMKYEGEWIKNMEWAESYKNCIQWKNCSYLAVTNNVWLKQWKNEWEWWIMKVSASKYGMGQIMKIFIQSGGETALTLLLQIMFYWVENKMNESDEVWRWVHQKYEMSWIIQKFNSI